MAYYCNQAGSGLADGTSVANAASYATLDAAWGTAADQGDIYLLDTITSEVVIKTAKAFTLRGDESGHACTIDTSGTPLSWNTKDFLGAGLVVRDLAVQGGTTLDLWAVKSSNFVIYNVTGDGTTGGTSGAQMDRCTDYEIYDCDFQNYENGSAGSGIDILSYNAVFNTDFNIHDNICSNNKQFGIKARCGAGGPNEVHTGTIASNTCVSNGQSGIELAGNTIGSIHGITVELNTITGNGYDNYGTGIELYGAIASAEVYSNIIRYNTVSGTLDADSDGTDGAGIRCDEWAHTNLIYGNTSTNDVTGFVLKNYDNYLYSNIVLNPTKHGIKYAGLTGGTDSTSAYIYNNVIDGAGEEGILQANLYSDDPVIKNNILLNCVVGIRIDTAAAGYDESNNSFYGCTDNMLDEADGTVAPTSPETTDPDLDANYIPSSSSSPVVGAGVKWWGDDPRPDGYNGEPFPDTQIDIGANQTTFDTNHPSKL